ncbi:class I SAM-dependent methyltransferase [Treponema sp.]|uniref:class I SAM-dependent methyltransferase n=1 Tax=Treponema sp. TaxID=166 RepID=UPI003F090369
MKFIQNFTEYYDELFNFSEAQKNLYLEFCRSFDAPVHFLRVSCGSGLFETFLAKQGNDVTGIESCEELMHAANLRRRTQLMSIRFFRMDNEDMTRFLGKNFYNVISILDSRLLFFGSKEKIQRFFSDCRKLMAPGGLLVIQCINFEYRRHEHFIQLPEKRSLRAKIFSEIITGKNSEKLFSMNLETGNGKIVPVAKDIPLYPLLPAEIEQFAEAAGFTSADFFADYDKSEFTGNEEEFVVILK